MAMHQEQNSLNQGSSIPDPRIEPQKQSRIQTAEGWKRSQLKKRKSAAKAPSKS
jgi:hypothetical protein